MQTSKKRRRHDSAFKARVALEAVKGEKTIHEIAKSYEVHPTQVTEWKKTLLDNVSGVFEPAGKPGGEDFENERAVLRSKIGELTIALDFLEKKSKQLGL
jgi:transposase